jgi:glycosyltransferase involved in cell wall biosynthesis
VSGPLRLALLADQYPALSETFVAEEARTLVELGYAVHVEACVRAAEPNPAVGGPEAAYRSDDTPASRLSDLLWLAARHPLRCARDLLERRRWRRQEPLPPLRELAPPARRIAAFGAAHLHAHFAQGAALDALRIGALLGLPYSVMSHGYDIFQLPRNLREKHERAAFAVTACDYSARWLRERLGPGPRIETLVVGVDCERFQRRLPHPGGRTVIAVARLVEKKGLRYLIQAAALLERDDPLHRVLIVGSGPLELDLRKRARSLGVGNLVEFFGGRSPQQVGELIERSDLLVAPCVIASDGDRDTMPVVVKEALALEVPVVASDEVGLPEVVRREWGRLVPPADPAALARAIAEVLALPAEARAEMGRAGREFVLRHCDLRSETRRLSELIGLAAAARDSS